MSGSNIAKQAGDKVLAGSINKGKDVEIKVLSSKKTSHIARVLEAVKQSENKRTAPIENINHFYGLFELKLEYFNPIEKSIEDLEKLKKEYLRMMVEKLQIKYTIVKFPASDKIFFYSERFSVFNSLSEDFVKLYQIFYDLNFIGSKQANITIL